MRSLLRKSILAMHPSDLDGLSPSQLRSFLGDLQRLNMDAAPIAAAARDRLTPAAGGARLIA
ncbi:MAG: hypothetical protein KDJ44_01800 [Rhodoblastus sp.]|jgi:hypothetical protein|nr:hypothetical protein [Rhodoblastus sp.]MCC2106197.1 hypothetical protein [Hyphomicrobiales bacterium]